MACRSSDSSFHAEILVWWMRTHACWTYCAAVAVCIWTKFRTLSSGIVGFSNVRWCSHAFREVVLCVYVVCVIAASQSLCVPSEPGVWSWRVPRTYSASNFHLSCSPCKSRFSLLHFTSNALHAFFQLPHYTVVHHKTAVNDRCLVVGWLVLRMYAIV